MNRAVILISAGLAALLIILITASALSNIGLPTHSQTVDRLPPDWKEQALADGVFLEDLLRTAVTQQQTGE